jgi:hypothetical protein
MTPGPGSGSPNNTKENDMIPSRTRIAENDLLEAADSLDPSNQSPEAQKLRETARFIRAERHVARWARRRGW